MADIDIVPKQRSYTWLWVVLALVILAAVWYALSGGNERPADVPVGQLLPQLETLPSAAVRAS